MVSTAQNALVYNALLVGIAVGNHFERWMRNDINLQKDLCLFRALPYASVCVVKYLGSELSDIPRHPHPRLPDGRLKSRKYKKSAVGGKKSPATPVQKMITLFTIGCHHIDGIHKLLFFYRQRRPFFTAKGRFLNRVGCCRHAAHGVGGWRRRHGGKLVFRLASPPIPKRRSRQQPPWLFVFISTSN